jgi:hypothetical protein
MLQGALAVGVSVGKTWWRMPSSTSSTCASVFVTPRSRPRPRWPAPAEARTVRASPSTTDLPLITGSEGFQVEGAAPAGWRGCSGLLADGYGRCVREPWRT